ncbi:histone H4-like TAF Taf6, SAGA complex subunit [Coniosporium apollinis]|uniref:Histone H4-like TAF Taf6, SAGA complex subunit n=1 Tax=Coniosporium apollinis TaxID=61459 RepID=A0ABQ9NJM9_9PEZI|nr:histone H4-like TAF Taf6, SAGA complex subunit [Coniosporium apollinis]
MTSTRWNPDNIRDVAESVGIATLQKDVVEALAQDVDYRMQQVIVEALKFMRHSRRTTLSTQDIAQALRVLDVEPLYGYESTRPLRFGEASIGPGQPLYYVEDEEVDFEKLINAPLPKVPREISFTAHWLAVEGVQPSIPQNPTTVDSRHQELLPKGPGANPNLAALSGNDNVSVKPLVKHVLSKELQLYFDQVSNAMLDETNDEYRSAALASLRTDPGLHQLVPYFVQFIAEKVTHSLKDLFILTQMMHLTQALLENPSLFVDPYIASVVPPVLTCLVGKRLGSANDSDSTAHFALRDLAGSILIMIAKKYGKSSQTLRSRIARTCLKHFLDPNKPFGTHYGAVIGLQGIAGTEGIRQLIIPNLKVYDGLLKEGLADDARRADAEMVVAALLRALQKVERDTVDMANGYGGGEELRSRLADKVGDVIASRVLEMGRPRLISAVLASDVNI